MTTPQWCSRCPLFLRAAPISFGIDAIIRSIISDEKPWNVLVHDHRTVYRSLSLLIFFMMAPFLRNMPRRWNMFLIGFRTWEWSGFTNITRISSRSRSLVCTFKQVSIPLVKVFSSQETLFSAYWCPYLCCLYAGHVWQMSEVVAFISTASWISVNENVPTYLLKLCNALMISRQSQITNSCFSLSPKIFVMAVV